MYIHNSRVLRSLSLSVSLSCREEAIRNYSGTPSPNLQNSTEVERKLFEQSRNGVSNIFALLAAEALILLNALTDTSCSGLINSPGARRLHLLQKLHCKMSSRPMLYIGEGRLAANAERAK